MIEFGDRLPKRLADMLGELPRDITELRLRANKAPVIVASGEARMVGGIVDASLLAETFDSLCAHSAYARADQLREGFFTLPNGCRVGVCGRWAGGELTHIGSMCLRAAREVRGAADGVMPLFYDDSGYPRSVIVLSPPGMGKTTLLRDAARRLSLGGECGPARSVAIADERSELAACRLGVPTLDVGLCDVADALPKAVAVMKLLRAMAPEVIVTDEIGGPGDAEALREAARCGVRLIASAHAESLEGARRRAGLRELMECFDVAVTLGGYPGNIVATTNLG